MSDARVIGLKVIRKAIAYRRCKEYAAGRRPVRPEAWSELVAALDELAMLGGEAAFVGTGEVEKPS